MENMQECSQPIQGKTSPSDLRMQEDEGHNLGQKLHNHGVDARGEECISLEILIWISKLVSNIRYEVS